MRIDVFVVERQSVGEMHKQAAEQRRIHARRYGQEQVGVLRGRRAPRVDHDDFGAARPLVGDHALIQHGMAPSRIGADENDEIGEIEVGIGAGHGIGAEGTAVAGDRRRHAQPRIGVDIAGADEALHQLVGDVIVLGQQLAGEIEGNRIGTVFCNGPGEAIGHSAERGIPTDARHGSVRLPHHRMQQARVETERLAQRRTLGAKPTEIRRMVRIASDYRGAAPIGLGQHATAHAAIRACRAHGRRMM